MSKKIIALVLFVAMMIALVPTANAAADYTDTYPIVDINTATGAVWYGGQNYTKFGADGNPHAPNSAAVLGMPVANGTSFMVGERIYENATVGMTVSINNKVQDGNWVFAGASAGASKRLYKSQNINVKGSFSKLQPFYYTNLTYQGAMGVAIKVPVTIYAPYAQLDADGWHHYNLVTPTTMADGDHSNTVVNDSATVNGYSGYVNTYNGQYYLTAVLGEADGVYTYKIWYANSKYYTVTITWDNTDNDTVSAFSTSVPTMSVVGIAGKQVDNFRATYTNAYYKTLTKTAWNALEDAGKTYPGSIKKYESKDKYYQYIPGVLEFDIAAMTKSDRAAILGINKDGVNSMSDVMVAKMKALDKNGYAYPQGTIVTFLGESDQNFYLGASDKFVTVSGEASYLVDNAGCFNLSFSGIQRFAMYAGNRNYNEMGNLVDDITAFVGDNPALKDDGNVWLYTLAPSDNTATVVNGYYTLRFSYGTSFDTVTFGVKFQNVSRTKSGITLLADTITLKVGEEVGIPYIITDPMAMYQGVKTPGWTYVNKAVAEGKDTDSAIIIGKKVGTTYAYATDFADNVQLIVINVVAADAVTTPVVTPAPVTGTKYVVTASILNVRTGAGTSYSKLGKVTRNTVVIGNEVAGSAWIKIETKLGSDGYGYVSGKYLAEVE